MGWLAVWGADRVSKRAASGQLGLHEAPRTGRGGYRSNAGRKKSASGRTRTPHRARPALSRYVPVHVTLRAARRLPSFREEVIGRAIGRVIRAMRRVRDDFAIVEFSIQSDHVHLIVEAEGERELSSGIRSLQTRVTKVLNNHILRRRRGKVWGDRYFRVDLTTPTQARHALAYVLQNGHHHGVVAPGVKDPLSSARWSSRYVTRPELPLETSPTTPARTFMLEVLWERRWPGAISPTEIPG
jgi:putative transposase